MRAAALENLIVEAKGEVRTMDDETPSEGSDEEDLNEEDCRFRVHLMLAFQFGLADGKDERERQLRIQENATLLSTLGLTNLNSPASSSSLFPLSADAASTPNPRKRKKPSGPSAPVFDRSGHILSMPRPGEKHVMACVEISSDRRIKKRINDREYTDCIRWAEGEARRWRFGFAKGKLEPGEEEYVGEVGPAFRWRRWSGLQRELRRELRRRDEITEADQGGSQPVPTACTPAYSALTGSPCHQCRRKSEKPKMKCRNLNPECKASFCETCCRRYSYFEFDPESRHFICPLCKDCCNCANCIRKGNLAHLLDGKLGLKIKTLKASLLPGMGDRLNGEGGPTMTIQDVLAQAVAEKVNVPFDCVRIVNEAEDVITPDLPPEIVPVVEKKVIPKGRKVGKKGKMKVKKVDKAEGTETLRPGKRTKYDQDGMINGEFTAGEASTGLNGPSMREPTLISTISAASAAPKISSPKLLLKFKVPNFEPHQSQGMGKKRVKEVDSDGDTVGGNSSDEDGDDSSLTSLYSEEEETGGLNSNTHRLSFSPRNGLSAQVNGGSGPNVFPGYQGFNGYTKYPTLSHVPNYVTLGNPSNVVTPTSEAFPTLPVASQSSQEMPLTGSRGPSPPPSKRFKPRPKNATILREPRYSQTPSPPKPASPLPAVDPGNVPPNPEPEPWANAAGTAVRRQSGGLAPALHRSTASILRSALDEPAWLSYYSSASMNQVTFNPSNMYLTTQPHYDMFSSSVLNSTPAWYAAQLHNPPPYSHSPPSRHTRIKMGSLSYQPLLPRTRDISQQYTPTSTQTPQVVHPENLNQYLPLSRSEQSPPEPEPVMSALRSAVPSIPLTDSTEFLVSPSKPRISSNRVAAPYRAGHSSSAPFDDSDVLAPSQCDPPPDIFGVSSNAIASSNNQVKSRSRSQSPASYPASGLRQLVERMEYDRYPHFATAESS